MKRLLKSRGLFLQYLVPMQLFVLKWMKERRDDDRTDGKKTKPAETLIDTTEVLLF
jgi:hypothetical protein